MYCTIPDFLLEWQEESAATEKLLAQLTDESLHQRITSEGRTLGRLVWHVVQTMTEMPHRAGLFPTDELENQPCPPAKDTRTEYVRAAAAVADAVVRQWTDDQLRDEVEMYGEVWSKGRVLSVLVRHQAHHRGQMTVLMRQAGLRVPGVYGPAREEWAEMGVPAME
ncbi:DinB family protein [Solirubrum puertoriconensis]|uniref:Damage-inducible protein DinB n=1 Tax=Solirubrum puertoriconensis TaxID=1751427 RepID=A0A9X0HPA6_SOLP1|nr:DinB family protein [Solirubrum puertoriconensis]KUG09610.1 hypothetical protein ASU33_18100 [Solirubrum puertoriconensis]